MKDDLVKLESIYINDFYEDLNSHITEHSTNTDIMNKAHLTIGSLYKKYLEDFTNNKSECPEIRVLVFEGLDDFASINIFHSQYKQEKYKII